MLHAGDWSGGGLTRTFMVVLVAVLLHAPADAADAQDDPAGKYAKALTAVSKINGLKLPDDRRDELLARWFQFGGTIARQQCDQLLKASMLAEAEAWAEKERQLAEDCLKPQNRARVASLMNLAKVQFLQPMRWDAALESFSSAADQAQAGSHLDLQVEALMGVALIRLSHDGNNLIPVATLLKRARTGTSPSSLNDNAMLFVWNRIWFPIYQQASQSSDGAASAFKILKHRLQGVAAALTKEGVDSLTASAGMLLLPRLALDVLDLEAARIGLKELDIPERRKEMPAFWQVQLLSLKARLAAELSLFAEARRHLDSALQKALENHLDELVAVLKISLGELLIRQGDYDVAEDVLRDTVELYEKHPRLQNDAQRPVALSDLARTYEGRGRYERAEDLYREAITLLNQVSSTDSVRVAMVQNNLAANYYMAGNFAESEKLFRSVLKSMQTNFGPDHLRVAEVYANLGWLAMESGDVNQAWQHWETSLDGVQRGMGDAHPRVAEIMSYLGRAEAVRGNKARAEELLSTALNLREQHLERTMRSALSERDRLAIVQELRVHPESAAWPGVFDTWLELADLLNIPAIEQYEGVLRWKGTLDRFHTATAELSGVDAALLERRADVLAQLRTAYFGGWSTLSRRQQRELVAKLESEANGLEREIRDIANVAPRKDQVRVADLQTRLPQGAALLDVIQVRHYARRDVQTEVQDVRTYTGFLLRADQPIQRIDFGAVAAFDQAALAFYKDISSGNPDFAESGSRLTRLIRSPLEEKLEGVEVLIVSGDGLFHMLPLGALPGAEPDSFWLDQLAFASVGNARELLPDPSDISQENRREPLSALVVGGVEYGPPNPDLPRRSWSPLPGTQRESQAIARQLAAVLGEDRVTLTGDDEADERRVTSQLQKRQLIHLATHGFFSGSSGRPGDAFDVLDITAEMDSAIVLAGANAPPEGTDQLLTAEELGNQDLRHVRLLVLSACQTGLGHVRAGQGVVGLLGALGRAGVRSMISSLWEVNDEATEKLMTSFYAELSRDSSPLGMTRALRNAQLKLRRGEVKPANGGSFKHPRFWAPFFLSGSTQGIPLNDASAP